MDSPAGLACPAASPYGVGQTGRARGTAAAELLRIPPLVGKRRRVASRQRRPFQPLSHRTLDGETAEAHQSKSTDANRAASGRSRGRRRGRVSSPARRRCRPRQQRQGAARVRQSRRFGEPSRSRESGKPNALSSRRLKAPAFPNARRLRGRDTASWTRTPAATRWPPTSSL